MKRKAVIYTRVSTDEQKENGFSLQDQKARLLKYCIRENIEVIQHYEDDHSAKNFKRPAFQKFLQDIKDKSVKPDLFLCVRMDRFSRNLEESLGMLKNFTKWGIEFRTLENNVSLDTPESLIPFILNMVLPQVDNERRGLNTKVGMRQARREGRWTGTPPKGYRFERSGGISLLKPTEDAPFIQEAFETYGKGVYSKEEVRRGLMKKGFKVSKNQFGMILQNPAYIGKIRIAAWRDEPEEIVEGLHEGLISEELFKRVQAILKGRKIQPSNKTKRKDELPLRGFLNCACCGNKLTGSKSKGNGGGYYYYHCQQSGHQRFRADKANALFVQYLKSINIPEEIAKLYYAILKDVFKVDDAKRLKTLEGMDKQIAILKTRIESNEDAFMDGAINESEFKRIKNRYENNLSNLNLKYTQLQFQKSNFQKYMDFGFTLLMNLDRYYIDAPLEVKQKIIGSIFPENLIFEEGNYRTTKETYLLEAFGLINKDLGEKEKDFPENTSEKSYKAPPQGLEPWTYGLTVRRSNQLS